MSDRSTDQARDEALDKIQALLAAIKTSEWDNASTIVNDIGALRLAEKDRLRVVLKERDEYGKALARLGEKNPEFMEGGKGSWQVRAEHAEAGLLRAEAALRETKGHLERYADLKSFTATIDAYFAARAALSPKGQPQK